MWLIEEVPGQNWDDEERSQDESCSDYYIVRIYCIYTYNTDTICMYGKQN